MGKYNSQFEIGDQSQEFLKNEDDYEIGDSQTVSKPEGANGTCETEFGDNDNWEDLL